MEIELICVVNDLINCSYAMKPPIKTLDTKLSRAFRFVNTWVGQDGARKVVPEPSGQEQLSKIPCSQGPLELARLSWLPPPST